MGCTNHGIMAGMWKSQVNFWESVLSFERPWASGTEHRLSGLCGKGSDPLSHLTGLNSILRKEFRFEELMPSMLSKLRQGVFLCRNEESTESHWCPANRILPWLLCPLLLCSGVGLFGFLLPPQHTLARPVLRVLFRLICLHPLQQHWSQKPVHITLQSPSRAAHAWALNRKRLQSPSRAAHAWRVTQAMASVS